MTNEKNIQNADMPTKDTRQYKHTPIKSKRLVGKIFALVGCLAVLLSCLALPSSAVGVFNDSDPPYAPYSAPFMPSQISIPVYGVRDVSTYICLDCPYTKTEDYTQWIETIDLGDDETRDFRYYNSHNAVYSNLECEFVDSYSFLDGGGDLRLSYETFTYTPLDKYFLPGYDQTNLFELDFDDIESFEVQYEIGYLPVENGELGDYVERNITLNEYGDHFNVDLYGVFKAFGILDMTGYIEHITINIITPQNSEFIGYVAHYNSDLVEAPLYATKYIQVINEGKFSNLFDWLGSTVSGFFDASLFTIGDVTVTPAIILGAVLSFLLIFAFLRFFSGG